MRKVFLFISTFISMCFFLINSCSKGQANNNSSSEILFVASTPGDSLIKSLLTINPDSKVDFIRWDLTFTQDINHSKKFLLNINYGEGQPNTTGFIGGGQRLTLKGIFTIDKSENGNSLIEIYHLKSSSPTTSISMVKLNDNLLHLLTPDNKLMVGNGGWSYTLNRKKILDRSSAALPALANPSFLLNDHSQQVIFEGRTPCADFAKEYNLQAGSDCIKLKWLLTLHRDPKTFLPTTYTLKRTLHRSSDITGKWTILKGTDLNPNAIIYQLDPDKPKESVAFLVGDENVIFFMTKDNRLFTGDNNFSYTLNRRKQ